MMLYVNPIDVLDDYSILIATGSMISIIFSTFMYYFGRIGEDERSNILYKNEIRSVVLNLILFVVVITVWQSLKLIGGNIVEKAQDSIDEELLIYPSVSYELITKYLPTIGVLSSLSSSISVSSNYRSIWVFKAGDNFSASGFSIVLDRMNSMYNNAMTHIIFLSGLKYLLKVLEYFSILFFFPLGIFFRSFSYTRRLGSTMVAIAIGAGFVLPFSVYLYAGIVGDIISSSDFLGVEGLLREAASSKSTGALNTLRNAVKFLYGGLYGIGIISRFTTSLMLALNFVLAANIPLISDAASGIFSSFMTTVKSVIFGIYFLSILVAQEVYLEKVIYSDYFPLMAQALTGITIGLSLFYFAVAATVIAFIRSFSSILGGEFFLYGVERLI